MSQPPTNHADLIARADALLKRADLFIAQQIMLRRESSLGHVGTNVAEWYDGEALVRDLRDALVKAQDVNARFASMMTARNSALAVLIPDSVRGIVQSELSLIESGAERMATIYGHESAAAAGERVYADELRAFLSKSVSLESLKTKIEALRAEARRRGGEGERIGVLDEVLALLSSAVVEKP